MAEELSSFPFRQGFQIIRYTYPRYPFPGQGQEQGIKASRDACKAYPVNIPADKAFCASKTVSYNP